MPTDAAASSVAHKNICHDRRTSKNIAFIYVDWSVQIKRSICKLIYLFSSLANYSFPASIDLQQLSFIDIVSAERKSLDLYCNVAIIMHESINDSLHDFEAILQKMDFILYLSGFLLKLHTFGINIIHNNNTQRKKNQSLIN